MLINVFNSANRVSNKPIIVHIEDRVRIRIACPRRSPSLSSPPCPPESSLGRPPPCRTPSRPGRLKGRAGRAGRGLSRPVRSCLQLARRLDRSSPGILGPCRSLISSSFFSLLLASRSSAGLLLREVIACSWWPRRRSRRVSLRGHYHGPLAATGKWACLVLPYPSRAEPLVTSWRRS